jgi:hypothetical protein
VTSAADGALGLGERDRVPPKWEQAVVEAGAPFTFILLLRRCPNSLLAVVEGGAGYLVDYYRKAAIARD